MTDLSIEELEELFTKTPVPNDGYSVAQLREWEDWHSGPSNDLVIPDVGTVSYVDSYGGEEMGSAYWVVVKLVQVNGIERLFRKDGRYYSYMYEDCFEYSDSMYEVKARERTVIEYS